MRRTFYLILAATPWGCTLEPLADPPPCVVPFEVGDDQGHDDPFGAKAARQARAGRLANASEIPPPAHGKQGYEDGDFILVNDKIAVVIEDADVSDGYNRYGGELIGLDKVGDDGRPIGVSRYLETLYGLSLTSLKPSSVSVLSDGSDGGEAIVRVAGVTVPVPFLEGSLGTLFADDASLEVAHDYVLAPGSDAVTLRVSVRNTTGELIDLGGIKYATDEYIGLFHGSHHDLVTPEEGFADAPKLNNWIGFVTPDWGFAIRSPEGQLEFALEESGFQLLGGPGLAVDACSIGTSDRLQFIGGGPEYDGLREAVRRVDEEEPWRAITGTVLDAGGEPIAGAFIHELDEDDAYVSRTRSAADGTFTIHAPPSDEVLLVAHIRGYGDSNLNVPADVTTAELRMAPHGNIAVTATATTGERLPVRVQVIPTDPVAPTPVNFGVPDEVDGRLHQEFAIEGEATLVVPPGEHRVIVTRGYEWELLDTTVEVDSGETVNVDAVLEHSVDSTDVMCADFHIHSFQSPDSNDPVDFKVKGAVADGLDIPVSSEHEWVVDFGPVVEALGLSEWAYGMPSSEYTTFKYGHFGVVPLEPRPGVLNNGAIDWIDKTTEEAFASVDERPEKPALIVNHPSGGGFAGFFSTTLLDKETGEPRDRTNWSDNFDAIEVFNDSTFDDNRDDSVAHWFALLNKGVRVLAVGNSDSHYLRTRPVGYPRTCFYFGHDAPRSLTHDVVRDAVLSGNSTISGGLFMTVLGPDGERPGSSIAPGSTTFTVTIEGPSWITASELEVIVAGETVQTEPLMPLGTGPSNRYVNQITLDVSPGEWVVFHARSAQDLSPLHPGRTAFAASNPFFVD